MAMKEQGEIIFILNERQYNLYVIKYVTLIEIQGE